VDTRFERGDFSWKRARCARVREKIVLLVRNGELALRVTIRGADEGDLNAEVAEGTEKRRETQRENRERN
jgi:hypothetical protein